MMTAERMNELAKELSMAFIKDKTDLEAGLVKIAREKNLSAVEVDQIAKRANRLTTQIMNELSARKKVPMGFDYPMIDSARALDTLNTKDEIKPLSPSLPPSRGELLAKERLSAATPPLVTMSSVVDAAKKSPRIAELTSGYLFNLAKREDISAFSTELEEELMQANNEYQTRCANLASIKAELLAALRYEMNKGAPKALAFKVASLGGHTRRLVEKETGKTLMHIKQAELDAFEINEDARLFQIARAYERMSAEHLELELKLDEMQNLKKVASALYKSAPVSKPEPPPISLNRYLESMPEYQQAKRDEELFRKDAQAHTLLERIKSYKRSG